MPWSELSLGPGAWILLVVLGAVLGTDAVSWPQVMVSRPLVSATVGGWLLGDPLAGAFVGAVLEVFALRHAPLGAARYPDTGPAGLIAGAAYASSGGESMGGLLAALVVGWALGWIGGVTVHVRRRLNERLLSPPADLASDPALLEQRHRLAIWLDALRGSVLVASFAVPGILLVAASAGAADSALGGWSALALVLGLAAAMGSAARGSTFGTRGWPLLVAGAAAGALLIAQTGS